MAFSALLVANPTARSGAAQVRIQRALEAMRARGWSCAYQSTEPQEGTIPRVVERLREALPDVVIYLGGDGTFREVAAGLVEARRAGLPRVPLGMLPSGTANDQGKSFGIAADEEALDENLDIIGAMHLVGLDAGRIQRLGAHGQPDAQAWFFDSAGFGFQPDVLHVRNRDRALVRHIPLLRQLYRDQAIYAGAALNRYLASWLSPTKFDAVVVGDSRGEAFTGLTDLVIKATPIYGGEWVLDRWGFPDDGLFEIIPFVGRRDLVSKAIRDLKHLPIWQEDLDRLGIEHSKGFRARQMDIRLHRPERAQVQSQVDGEEWLPGTHFRIEVLQEELSLVARAGWVPPWKEG